MSTRIVSCIETLKMDYWPWLEKLSIICYQQSVGRFCLSVRLFEAARAVWLTPNYLYSHCIAARQHDLIPTTVRSWITSQTLLSFCRTNWMYSLLNVPYSTETGWFTPLFCHFYTLRPFVFWTYFPIGVGWGAYCDCTRFYSSGSAVKFPFTHSVLE